MEFQLSEKNIHGGIAFIDFKCEVRGHSGRNSRSHQLSLIKKDWRNSSSSRGRPHDASLSSYLR